MEEIFSDGLGLEFVAPLSKVLGMSFSLRISLFGS